MESTISKSFLRKSVLQYRKLLDQESYLLRNNLLWSSVARFLEQKSILSIHTFLSMHKNREPDISSLLHGLWKSNVQVVVSKTNFKEQSLSHFILNEDIELVKNKMGIPEPMDAKETSIDHVEVILIPLLVSDKKGYRIGYGGGYYDRLLAETKAMKVGLSLSPPVDRIIQIEKWDVPLDYLITPFKTYKYG